MYDSVDLNIEIGVGVEVCRGDKGRVDINSDFEVGSGDFEEFE